MKKFLTSFISIIFIFTSLSTTLAQEQPPICFRSPDALNKYFSTIINVLNKVKSTNPQNSWWLKWLGEKTLQNGLGWASILLFFTLDWIWNFFANFFVIFHSYYIVRDWTKLINFKPYLTNKFLQLGKNWWLYQNIPSNTLESIKQLFKENPYFLLIWDNITTYADFIKYLWKNQLAVEELYFKALVSKDISNCSSLNTTFIKNIEPLLGDYPINKDHVNQLCTILRNKYLNWWEEFKCDTSIQDFLKSLNFIKNLWEKSKWATTRFECNRQRLKNALFWIEFKDPKCEKYGSVKVVKWFNVWVKWKINIQWAGDILFNLTTNSNKKIIDTENFNPDFSLFKVLWNKIKSGITDLWNTISDILTIKTKDKNPYTIPISDKDEFKANISYIISTVSQNKKNMSVNLWWIHPWWIWKNIGPKFPELSYYIWKGICIIDPEKEWCKESWLNPNYHLNTAPGIYQNLVSTCENESPNLGNCRYK